MWVRNLRFSRRWRFKSRSSGLWRHVVLRQRFGGSCCIHLQGEVNGSGKGDTDIGMWYKGGTVRQPIVIGKVLWDLWQEGSGSLQVQKWATFPWGGGGMLPPPSGWTLFDGIENFRWAANRLIFHDSNTRNRNPSVKYGNFTLCCGFRIVPIRSLVWRCYYKRGLRKGGVVGSYTLK
jgi:hypothetical protein